ncbi:flagellar basal body rod protein FlgB [Neobacillus sp. D3-1R]|uniref:flagellar basal body rod protein FlgB n=1 Tax=Neobacillus sp. D3-1R TaxID=3445778 RepID=UPI003FA0D241
MKLFSGTISTLEQSLNYSSVKQKIISQNIANVDTPNYKAMDVSFKDVLENELHTPIAAIRTDKRHFDFKSSVGSNMISRNPIQYNQNGNSVDLDKEMADLATNQIYYNAMIERINGKFSTLQNVIRGGK